jgi:hypothetical protein
MRRVKADAWLHAHGMPLLPLVGDQRSLFFEDHGITYRERLMAVEREILWQRTPFVAHVPAGSDDADPEHEIPW